MRCPRCEQENRDGRRFCAQCGTALPVACGACGFLNESADRFCGGCGAAIGAAPAVHAVSPARDSGERRQVTVLFADLTGFTRLTGELGAEATHALLKRYLATVDDVIAGYGGTVEYIGDGVMALFGAPVAHGDDPMRAVRAAGDIHRAMASLSGEIGRPLNVHIGVASGEVVAAGLGRDGKAKYTAIGESVNLASRLHALAQPGETLISDAVRRNLDQRIDSECTGEVAVKGFDRPVRVWRIVGYREGAPPAFDTPFVGRQAELGQFVGISAACRETGTGRTVLLRGEAGIGKSRLAVEFAAIAASQGFACHKGLVLDFGVGKGQDAVRAVVRSLLGIEPGAAKELRMRARDLAVDTGMIAADQRVFLNDLLDLAQPIALRAVYDAMDSGSRAHGREAVLEGLIRATAVRAPVLIVIEDGHWADASTLGYIAAIARTVAECPAILLMTTRLDGDPIDAGWRARIGALALTIIDLGPLRRDDARALAAGLAASNDVLIRQCIERAEGNPLFLEQLLRNAQEGLGDDVPASIQSLVLARMDRLAARDKRALQAASVVGQRFSLGAVRALLDDADYDGAVLLRHHLIRPESNAYLFAHALIREGIYGSLLGAARRELHQRAAAWYGAHDPVLRAQHLDAAEDAAAAGAYLVAARAQAGAYNNERAMQLVERGLAAARTGADRYHLSMLHGELLLDSGATADSLAAFGRAHDNAFNDVERCAALIGIAACLHVIDRYDEALAALAAAEAIAAANGLTGELARIHYRRGNIHFPQGRMADCMREHQAALSHARAAGSPEAEARALGGLADAAYMQGRFLTAHDHYVRCVEVARRHGFGRIEVANLNMAAITRIYTLDFAATRADCVRAITAAVKVGSKRAEMIAHHGMHMVSFLAGDRAEAGEHARRSLDLALQLGARRFEAESLAFIAQACQAEGARVEAERLLSKALAISRETGMHYVGALVLGLVARVSDQPAARAQALGEAEALLADGAVSHNYVWFYPEAIDLALEEEDWARAERHAAALESYMRAEPTPYTDFHVARARALAAYGCRQCEEMTRAELRRLRAVAAEAGLQRPLPAIDRALANW